jgi:DNA-binding CsgD family transcriptional regulator
MAAAAAERAAGTVLATGAPPPEVETFRARLEAIYADMCHLRQSAPSLDRAALDSSLEQLEALVAQTIAQLDELTGTDESLRALPDHRSAAAESDGAQAQPVRPRRTRRGPASVRAGSETPLTDREREVVMLIGRGYTNEQIAAELHVVKGTVATHIQHLLTKLDCTSRVQVATWAAARGLLDGATPRREAKSTHI